MRFVLRMAWRETRSSWGRLLFFFVCVALGVAAIVVLRSVVQTVRITLTREARNIVGADLVVMSQQAWTGARREKVDRIFDQYQALDRADVIETQTMAVSGAGEAASVRLVELRGVGRGFPFYGAPELEGGQRYSHDLLSGHGALVQPEVLSALNVRPGDEIRLAGQPFVIRGVVVRDRVQRSSGLAFGPRVYIDLEDLRGTSLLGFGSRASHQIFVRAPDSSLNRLAQRLRTAMRQESVGVRSWRSVEDRLGRNLSIAENYLSLVGFAMVVLGGIGVWSVTRVVVQQKIRSVAILKCVGASTRQVVATYVLQIGWLALGGSLLGVALATAALAAIPPRVLEPLGITGVALTASAGGQGLAVGLLVSMLFALVPLLEVRRVKPLLLLRADTATTARRRDWQSWLAGATVVVALALVAVWQADSLRAGLYVSGGLAAVGLVLLLVSRVLIVAVRPLSRSSRFALRHAVISLGRPGNQTRVILMAVGIGCFFILAVRALQVNLLQEFSVQVGENAPDLILIDIQQDQVEGVGGVVSPFVRRPPRMLPLMRGRVAGVQGRRTQLADPDAVRRQGEMTREYGITYRDTLQDNETLVAGTFWTGGLAEPPADADTEVSIERQIHEQALVDLGDLMRFDIGGQVVRARVTSIREVTWDEAQNGGFIFVFRPSPALARVPRTFVGFLEVTPGPDARAALQRGLVAAYPNVSAIDVREVLESIRDVVDNVTLGVTIVGAVTLVGGMLILVGAVAMTRFQRLYEAAIYRTLGASTRVLASMVAIEYGIVGALAGTLGAAGALAMSWAMARGLFDITWRPAPGLLGLGLVLTAVIVSAVGLAASAEVIVRKPLATLRGEG
jgi:putative ABC transport system permease protein